MHGNQKCQCEEFLSHDLLIREFAEKAFCHQQVFKFRLIKELYRYCFLSFRILNRKYEIKNVPCDA